MPAMWPALLLSALTVGFLAAQPRRPRAVEVRSGDGTPLAADFYAPRGRPRGGLLLLPMLGADRSTWAPFAARAAHSGLAALALDPRGHGDSANPTGAPPSSWGREPWRAVVEDARAGLAELVNRGVPVGRIVAAGASIGATAALHAAAAEPAIAGAALLSPGDNPARLPASEALAAFGQRPLFIAAGAEDGDFPAIARRLAEAAPWARLIIAPGAEHGTGLLSTRSPGKPLEDELLEFLLGAVAPQPTPVGALGQGR